MNKSDRGKSSKHEDGADLISNLPDHILVLILSGLPSTEEVIRGSILSRRWRYLWTSVPSLDLVYPAEYKLSGKSKKSEFKEFVDRVLLNRSVDLDRFRLSCGDHFSMSTIERWIHAAVMRNVKQVDLDFCPSGEMAIMPHCLVTCASLEVFSLRNFCSLPKAMEFPALRVLRLGGFKLGKDSVKIFLESCPLLEDLTLGLLIVDKTDVVCISWQKLKKLRIFYSHLECGLKISCPNLVFLGLRGYVASDIICEGLYSLKEAIIGVMEVRLFPGISHVELLDTDLGLLYWSLDRIVAAACDPALPNLKALKLSSERVTFTLDYITKILKHCPELESLCLYVENDSSSYDPMDRNGPGNGKLDEAETRRILTPDVKWVESFEINGEKLKLDISWLKRGNEWSCIVAKWGKKFKCSDWMKRCFLLE